MGNVLGSSARVGWVALAALVVAVGVGRSRPASACTVCLQMVMLPDEQPNGVELPADRVAFRLVPGIKTQAVESALMLRAVESNLVIPASVKEVGGDRFYAPDQPLTPGQSYLLHYEGACQSIVGNIGPSKPKTLAILAGPAEEVPATFEAPPVTITLLENEPAAGQRTAVAKLDFDSDFFRRFRPVLAVQVEVDGQPFYGLPRVNHPPELTLEAACGSDRGLSRDSCSTLDNVLPGRHQVKVIPDVVGADRDPAPLTMDIDLRCDPPAASGCAAAGRPGAPPALAWLLALAAALAVRLPRRRLK
jgi:MYXO-CTERM domain-containing protein